MSENSSNIEVVLKATGTEAYSVKMANVAKAHQKFQGTIKGTSSVLHTQVNDLQATSASLRLFEGRMDGSIRAAERFLTTIPGVSTALKAAFPLVGGIALASMFVRLGTQVRDFIKQVNDMPNKLATGFSSLSDSLETSNDELAVTKDKLEKSIAILEHKPFNGMAASLDESKVAADKLYASLEKDRMAMAKMMEESGTNGFSGWFARNIEGKGDTRGIAGSINSYNDKISNLELKLREAQHNNDTKAAENFKKQVQQAEQSAVAWSQAQIKMRQGNTTVSNIDGTTRTIAYAGQYGDQSSNIDTAKKFESTMLGRLNQQSLEDAINKETLTQTNDEDANKRAEAAKAAAKKLDEVSKQFADTLGRSHMKEYTRSYYTDNNLQQPGKELTTPTQELAAMAAIKTLFDNPLNSPKYTSQMEKLNFKGSQIDTANKFNFQRALIGVQASTGQISPHEAALSNASVNQQEYLAQMKVFSDQLAKINSITDNTLTDDQKALQSKQVYNALAEAEGKRHLQVLQEQTDAMATTWQGGIQDALSSFAQQYSPSAIAGNLTTGTLNSVNNSLVSGMTTGHLHAASMFRDISSNIGHQALGGLESKFLPGLNKPKHVIVDNMPKGAAFGGFGGNGASNSVDSGKGSWLPSSNKSGFSGFISSLFGGGSGGIDTSAAANGAGSIATAASSSSDLLQLLPLAGFASGGMVTGGTPIIVGEHGPEIFNPGANGYITPNHRIANMSSGDTYIDARGASDPAATAVAVRNAIAKSAKQTAHNTLKAHHSAKINRPSGR